VVAALRSAGVPGPGPDRWLSPEIDDAVALVTAGGVVAAAESVIGPLH
jgi:histidine ammonia-lyase